MPAVVWICAMKVLPDTNVATGVGARDADFSSLQKFLQEKQAKLVIAPPVLVELVIKLLNGSDSNFKRNKSVFSRFIELRPEILELPIPFARTLLLPGWRPSVGIRPDDYWKLLGAIESSRSKSDFIRRASDRQCGWNRIQELPQIHQSEISRELSALRKLAADKQTKSFSEKLAEKLAVGNNKPPAQNVTDAFSAAFEYLAASVQKVRGGAKPEKNDRGVYVDFQILQYLADPQIVVLTSENFQRDIRNSPQASRIIVPEWG